jgi:hypothetical protein
MEKNLYRRYLLNLQQFLAGPPAPRQPEQQPARK